MNFTYQDFKLCIRSALLSHKSAFDLDVRNFTDAEIEKVMVWCERDGYRYSYNEELQIITIEILKGFSRVPQVKKKEDFLALFDGIEEDEEMNQRRMKNLEEMRH